MGAAGSSTHNYQLTTASFVGKIDASEAELKEAKTKINKLESQNLKLQIKNKNSSTTS